MLKTGRRAMFDICFIALHSVWARDALFGLLKSIV